MLGHKARSFKPLNGISMENLVPEGNFYRRLEGCLDLSFVHGFVSSCYSEIGRPSIDPVVFFKLQLIAFFEGIRSERQLMEMVNLNLAHRWYIGYDLGEVVPDHSSLSKIRERYGLEVFHRFFEHIIELCIQAGLVWGEELYFDSTKVQANAALSAMVSRIEEEANQHLEQLFPNDPNGMSDSVPPPGEMVTKYNGERITGVRKPSYQRIADEMVSLTDPDATPMRPTGGGRAVLGYRDHYVVDGGKARIILTALVTPASIMDNTPMLDLVKYVCSRWKIQPKQAAGDTKYGTVPNIVGLEDMGIKAYLPTPDLRNRTGFYPPNLFRYDKENDQYICPEKQLLPLFSKRKTEQNRIYRAKANICNACPVKAKCTDSKSGRYIFRSFFQEELDRAEAYQQTEMYQKAMRKRSVWVEPLFGEAKQFHRLRRFRLRGLVKVNIEGVLIATGQNIKRLMKTKADDILSIFRLSTDWLNCPGMITFSTS
ncbi:MAG TPA: IS1182 family transposase [Anaerolineales bacterium]|nr:IS1182 family transposase [Anaerolineales bacterium]